MADTTAPVPAAPAVAPQAAATTTPAAAPVEAAAPAALSSEAPAAAPLAAVEGAAVAEAAPSPEASAEPSSLLSEKAPAAVEAAPAEVVAPVESEIVLPTYEALKLPENVKLDEKGIQSFDQVLGKFEAQGKIDHAQVQQLRQELVDFYVNEQKEAAQRQAEQQKNTWDTVREGWRDQFKADPEIGKNRQETTLRVCRATIDAFAQKVGEPQAKAFRDALAITGMGDHPAMLHFVNWASQFVVERARPVPATVPKMKPTLSRAERRYQGTAIVNGGA